MEPSIAHHGYFLKSKLVGICVMPFILIGCMEDAELRPGEEEWGPLVDTTSTTGTTTSIACPVRVPNWQEFAKLDYEAPPGCGLSQPNQCYGNGECICNVCLCDVGWRGPYCSQLDLLPAKKAAHGIAMHGGHPTWGGSAVYDSAGNNWQLLAGSKIALSAHANLDPYIYWGRIPAYDKTAQAQGQDPFHGHHPWDFDVEDSKDPFPSGGTQIDASRDLYQSKSFLSLYESVGSDPAGPYQETVSKWLRAFRANLKVHPVTSALLQLCNANGGFLIIESRSGSIAGPWFDKSGNAVDALWTGSTPGSEPSSSTPLPPPVYKYLDNGHCSKGWSSLGALDGKYITKENGNYRECTVAEKDAWNCHVADPSFLIHSNGTTVITYRGTRCESADGHADHKERLGILYADCWNCAYTAVDTPLFEDDEVMNGGVEDLFMWVDSRGTHMIVHSQAQDHAYDLTLDEATFHHKKKRGAYLFSADGLWDWVISDWELFPSEIRWDDGTTDFLLKQQRPSLIFTPGTTQPTHLITGVDFLFDACCDWYAYGSGWTLIQPVSSCRAGEVLQDDGACVFCTEQDSKYGSRCIQATSKYGSCVCANCTSGYTGDNCEIDPVAVYTITCAPLTAKSDCDDETDAQWIGNTDDIISNCLALCEIEAKAKGAGCCFQNTGSSQNCRLFLNSGTKVAAVSANVKFASACTPVCVQYCP